MLAERRDPSHEYYVAVLNDRASQGPVLVASSQGGMNIEEVAAKDPEAIITTPIDFAKGLDTEVALSIAKKLGFKTEQAQKEAAEIFQNLYKIFKEKDATQIEINPMGETADGHVLWYDLSLRASECYKYLFFKAWTPNLGLMIMQNFVKRTYTLFVTSLKRSLQKSRLRNLA